MSKVGNTIKSIQISINKADRILYKIKPLLGDEANKKINEIKSKLPTETNIRNTLMNEINSKGPELVCSIEIRNRVEYIYFKLKQLINDVEKFSNSSKERLLNLQSQLSEINIIIEKVRGIFTILKKLVGPLNIAVQVAKVALKFLKNQFADGAATVKLKDLIDQSKGAVKQINESIRNFERKLDKLYNIALKPIKIVTKALKFINLIAALIISGKGLIESYYYKYLTLCDGEGDSVEDESYSYFQSELKEKTEFPTIPQVDLSPNTIERIKNANFEVIQYRIA